MEVKVIFNLGEGDASTLTDLLAVLAKGQITSPAVKQDEEKTEAVPFTVVEDAKPAKKPAKRNKKVEAEVEATIGVDSANPGEDQTTQEVKEAKAEEEVVEDTPEAKKATLEDIRVIARKLADAGRQEDYRPILKKYGYAKVNLIEEKDFDAIYAEMSTLVGEE